MASAFLLVLLCQVADAAVPSTMKAGAITKQPSILDKFRIHLEDIQMIEVNVTSPKEGELLVKVAGSSMNPVDYKLLETPVVYGMSFPHVLGRDCAGTVVALGEGTTRFKVGDAVWADNFMHEGCFAEYAVLPESIASAAPSKLSLAESGALPLVALTGYDALKRFAGAPWPKGKTVVVLGGSGGVGHVGIQLAKAWGATKVITTCGTQNVDYCRNMGADQVIDYHKEQWYAIIPPRSVDVVFDTVGIAGTGGHAFDILKDGGFHATTVPTGLANPMKQLQRAKVRQTMVQATWSDYKKLDEIKEIVDAGKLRPHIAKTFTYAQTSLAVNASMSDHTDGKISVVPPPPAAMLV